MDSAAARMVRLLKPFLQSKKPDKDKGSSKEQDKLDASTSSGSPTTKQLVERCQALCSSSELDAQIQLRRVSDTEMEMRLVVGEVIVWQMDLQETLGGEVCAWAACARLPRAVRAARGCR